MAGHAARAAVLLALLAAPLPAAADDPPVLVVEAADSLAGVASQVRELDTSRLASIMRLTGLADAGDPIRVLLVPESVVLARDVPPWVAAFADAATDLVVLFPARIGAYPYSSLETVLFHEVAHILTARASGGGRIPRWFNEGLASAAERTWGLGARSRFAWEVVSGGQPSATALEALFYGSERDVVRAYALSDALVRDVLEQYGPDAPARILARMADGAPFEVALYAVTGYPVDGVLYSFWSRNDTWKSWISAAGHPFTQWSLITLLALAAIWSHRRRRRARRRQWDLEEQAEQDEWEEHRRRYRIH
jgi:MYXO-CTERM domain-containing protein